MPKKKTEAPKISIANLDEQGIYRGVMFIDAAELKPMHVQVPAKCDLAPGGYKWDSVLKTFMPIPEFIKQQRSQKG